MCTKISVNKYIFLCLHRAVHHSVYQLYIKIQIGQQYGTVKLHCLNFSVGYCDAEEARDFSALISVKLSSQTPGQRANAGLLPRALIASPASALSKLCPCHLRASQSSDRDAQLTALLRTDAFCSVCQGLQVIRGYTFY